MLNTTVSDKLHAAREVAWVKLQPAFDHAIALAREAEYMAQKISDDVQCNVAPAIPPLVMLLADSID